MEPQRDPSTFAGGAVKDLTAGGIAAAIVTVGIWLRELAPPPEVVLAMQVLTTVALGLLRRVGEEVLARKGGGSGKGAALGSIVALAAIVGLVGCASQKSIPTSSYSKIEDAKLVAKGGTIACEKGLRAVLDPATGNVTALDCAESGAWTDPPTEQEVTALGQFAGRLVDLIALPITMLRAALGVAP